MPYKPVLAVVIPVYNEAKNLPGLLKDWLPVFLKTEVSFTVILIDDGSKDDSLSLLQTLKKSNPRLDVHTQKNAGHGPAILKGYHHGAEADWVFQIDSDHQLDVSAFEVLWANREHYDLLLAQRREKNATAGRQRISAVSGFMVGLLFGNTVSDVNSPYRLMRGEALREALALVPADSFAPNILLTAWFVRKKKRIFITTTQNRTDGDLRKSKVSGHIFRGALRSAVQTILFRKKL